jgi:hypothetical protein
MLLTFFACATGGSTDGREPTSEDTTDGTTDATGLPEDTAPEGAFLDATYWSLSARFAVDGVTGRALRYGDRDEGLRPIAFTVTLLTGDALVQGISDETSCSATFETDGPLDGAQWAPDNGGWIGFDFPLDGNVRDRCRFYGLPPAFQGELASHVQKWTWGMGLAPLTIEVEDALRAQLPPAQFDALAPFVVGGSVHGDIFAQGTGGDPYLPAGYALGFEVDQSFVLAESAVGDPVPLPAELVWADDGRLGTGYYEVTVGFFDSPDLLTYR